MSAIIPRATVDQIVAQRNKALALYENAWGKLETAYEACQEANRAARISAAGAGFDGYNRHVSADDRGQFMDILKLPKRETFLADVRRITDTDVWSHIIRTTELERLMDKQAKDQFRQQIRETPPEATVENIVATLEQFMLDAGTIFKRGIAKAFSGLDRRFRSHDGWKIGSRAIMTRAFNETGSWNYYRNERDTIQDIERAFMVIEGKPIPPTYGGLVGAIEESRRGQSGARQSLAETEYFRARAFQNGNVHLWFKRDDLVDRVNLLLGEYYGAPIPEEREPDEDTGLHTPKTSLAKNFGFYPTPDAAAERFLDDTPLHRHRDEPPLVVLEPSAGTGSLAHRLVSKGCIVDCIEVHAERARTLQSRNIYRKVTRADFLTVQPDPARLYDRVVMNPPFDRERDIDHVMHALGFLKSGGILMAIMSAGTEFRDTKKSRAFRALMIRMGAKFMDLPPGSFASVGTYCNTIMLRVSAPDADRKTGQIYWGRAFEAAA